MEKQPRQAPPGGPVPPGARSSLAEGAARIAPALRGAVKVLSGIWAGLGTGVLCAYFLPTFVAEKRNAWDNYSIFSFGMLNLAFGWTGVGWVVLLIWAISGWQPRPSKIPVRHQDLSYKVVRQHNDNGTWT